MSSKAGNDKTRAITLDDHDAQSLEVARQVGTGLFIIWMDHLMHDDCVCNPLLNDLVIDLDDDPGFDSTARGLDQPCSSDCYTLAVVNDSCREFPRSVLRLTRLS